MRDKAKIIRYAKQLVAKSARFIIFQYDADMWGWATVSSPLGKHILGERPDSIFCCYSNPRNVEVHTR